MSQGNVKGKVRAADRGAKKASAHPAYKYLARGGFVVRAFLYGYMGVVALRVAATGGARQADQQASLIAVAGFPLGRVLLLAGIAFIAAYALWGFIRAIYDPLHRGDDAKGIATRLGFAWSGFAYTALTFFAIGLFTHGAGGSHPDDIQQAAARLLSAPGGVLLTEAAGLVGIAAGLSQFYDAYHATFKKDLKRGEMSLAEKRAADAVGRLGFISRGVVFALMGWFIFLAARQHDAHQAKGFSGTFAYLLTQPFGRLLLGLIAVGFIALGLHSLALARYIRLPGDRG
jgi:hypothetical protein